MFKNFNKKYIFAILVLWIIPCILYLPSIISGSIPFWYDPARDMLSGLDNLHKITLIGQTTGIPGIFYGPYWVWFLSFSEIFSKDPRWAAFIVQFFPYVFFGPIFMLGFRKVFGFWNCVLLWFLFIFGYSTYTFYLWNPQLAPLFFLISIYLLTQRKSIWAIFFSGIFEGLALNIHLSFTTGFILGTILFIVLNKIVLEKINLKILIFKSLKQITILIAGVLITFIPFFIFEIRHHFFQTKTAINAFIHGGGVVGVQGLSKINILQEFVKTFTILLHIPNILGLIFLILLGGGIVLIVYKKQVDKASQKLLTLLLSILICVFGLYMTAKNPIWEYHFIGLEIIYLLLLGIVVSRINFLKYIFTVWVVIIFGIQLIGFKDNLLSNPYNVSSLIAKEHIVNIVARDADSKPYTVLGYNPAIYIYDYSYLFLWMENKNFSYDPGKVEVDTNTVYLIFSAGASKFNVQNFINFRTPNSMFKTSREWKIPDGELIIKRTRISSI